MVSEHALDWVESLNDDELEQIKYLTLDKKKNVDILNLENEQKACGPIMHHSQHSLYKRSL